MRYLVGDAGHIQRLYLAVKTGSEYQVDRLQTLCEIYLARYRQMTDIGSRKRGLLKSRWRSAEPHFSFARELDLLEWRDRERWRTTFGAGRAFLNLWSNNQPPLYLLLHQFLKYDRTFAIPFLIRLVEAEYDFSTGRFVGLEDHVSKVWQEIWDAHHRELLSLEPPLPRQPGRRTLLHHAAARIRFLNRTDGLGLNIDKLNRLTDQFQEFEDSEEMPTDSFFRIGSAISDRRPLEMDRSELTEKVLHAFSVLQRAEHASAYAIYLFINEKDLPQKAVDWQTFASHVRKEHPFSPRASLRRDDFLITIEGQTEEAKLRR
jgi:hypothetical protein